MRAISASQLLWHYRTLILGRDRAEETFMDDEGLSYFPRMNTECHDPNKKLCGGISLNLSLVAYM
jgi:hypothetical protein